MIKQFFKNQLSNLGYRIVPFSQEKKEIFGSSAQWAPDYTIDNAKSEIYIKDLDLKLNLKKYDFFCKNYRFVKVITQSCGAKFYYDVQGNLICTIQGISIFIETGQDISTLREIFFKGCYNVTLPDSYCLIDIGLNVGITSLYFARDEKCKIINSYEPIDDTYNQALKNISINKSISSKIHTHNIGLGAQERVLEIDYAPEVRGSVGINKLPEVITCTEKFQKKQLHIKNATASLRKIIEETTSENAVVMKIDCEGAEYEILEDLYYNQLLHKVSAVLIEWHVEGPQKLIDYLNKAGFKTLSLEPYDKYIGALFAFK